MEACEMQSAMVYMVAQEDGEIVKMTETGFESTGMFIVPVGQAPSFSETVSKNAWVSANA
jgi:hypothetical protein